MDVKELIAYARSQDSNPVNYQLDVLVDRLADALEALDKENQALRQTLGARIS